MATKPLTTRQQEIKDLLDAGDTPADVAKKLKINENTIYQHLRRMKTGATTRRSTARKSTTRSRSGTTRRTAASGSTRSTTRRSSTRRTTRRSGGVPAAPSSIEVRPMTPLQAIRNRREYIEQEIKESARRLEAATKAFETEAEAHGRLEANRADELKKLTAAEAALSDAMPKKRSGGSRARSNGAGSKAAAAKAAQAAPAPAAAVPQAPAESAPTPAAPEPVEAPSGDEAMAVVGAEQERPGAETLPEFTQEDDGFGDDGAAE